MLLRLPGLLALAMALLGAVRPAAAAGVFDVTKYGAKGDGAAVDSAAVRAAAAACARAGGGTLLFPAGGAGAAVASPPCPAARCSGHANRTFCPSSPASGQCDQPMPHKPCPPCSNPSAGKKRGYVTGSFNLSSNMRVEIEPGVALLVYDKQGALQQVFSMRVAVSA